MDFAEYAMLAWAMSITRLRQIYDYWSNNGPRWSAHGAMGARGASPWNGTRAGRRAAESQAGQDRRRGDGALRQAWLRGCQGRGDRRRRRCLKGRYLWLLRQQGGAVPGRVPERDPHLQPVPRSSR